MHWVFVAHRLSLIAANWDPSCCGAQALGSSASVVAAPRLWRTGLIAVAHGCSCSAACGFFLDQGSNPCPLHWQADS